MLDKLQYWWDDAKLGIQTGQADALKRQFTRALDRLIKSDDSFRSAFALKASQVFTNTAEQYGGSFDNVSRAGHLKIAKQLIAESNRVFDTDMPYGHALLFMYFLMKSAALPGDSAKFVFDRCNLIFLRHVGKQERQNMGADVEELAKLAMSSAIRDTASKLYEPDDDCFSRKLQKFLKENELAGYVTFRC